MSANEESKKRGFSHQDDIGAAIRNKRGLFSFFSMQVTLADNLNEIYCFSQRLWTLLENRRIMTTANPKRSFLVRHRKSTSSKFFAHSQLLA